MIELLVVVAIIGILSAVAIPAYNNYQKNAREGVIESALQHAARTVGLQQSLGKSTRGGTGSVANTGYLDKLVTSKINPSFNAVGEGAPSVIGPTDGDWCIEVTTSDTDYGTNISCIDNDSTVNVIINSGSAAPTTGTGNKANINCTATGVCGT